MKIMVSACLIGDNTKYNGKNNQNKRLITFLKDYEIISVCPEVMGGLTIPRNPSEIKEEKVINNLGCDVTENFNKGALKTLELALQHEIKVAILKDGSPSCGSKMIYDGTFTNNKIMGMGITAKLLEKNGIKVLNENNYQEYFIK